MERASSAPPIGVGADDVCSAAESPMFDSLPTRDFSLPLDDTVDTRIPRKMLYELIAVVRIQ